MATVWIPALLRELTGGATTVDVPGQTVRQVIDHLDDAYPGMAARLRDGDELNPYIEIAVDGEIAPLGLLNPVGERSEVHILPAVAGGSPPRGCLAAPEARQFPRRRFAAGRTLRPPFGDRPRMLIYWP